MSPGNRCHDAVPSPRLDPKRLYARSAAMRFRLHNAILRIFAVTAILVGGAAEGWIDCAGSSRPGAGHGWNNPVPATLVRLLTPLHARGNSFKA